MTTNLNEKVGVIGDVHTEDHFLNEALENMIAQGAKTILCVGDIADGPGDINRCCELLQQFEVFTVRGNHDRWLLANEVRNLEDATHLDDLTPDSLNFLQALPQTRYFDSPMGQVMLCHGLGTRDMAKVSPRDEGYALESNFELQDLIADDTVQLVINGHSHGPMVRDFDGLTILNAGTLLRKHRPGYVIANFSGGEVMRYAFKNQPDSVIKLGQINSKT
ncbi:MAG: metallophosphoesterase family protein [Pseudomonadota bacterium]